MNELVQCVATCLLAHRNQCSGRAWFALNVVSQASALARKN